MFFNLIVATDLNNGIGKNGVMPWHLKADLQFFKKTTSTTVSNLKKNAVIMGKTTWNSIPEPFRPLSGRVNAVLSTQELSLPEGVQHFFSLDSALNTLSKDSSIETIFIVGGGKVYAEALQHGAARTLYLTRIHAQFDCDTFFPTYATLFTLENSSEKFTENGLSFAFETWKRRI